MCAQNPRPRRSTERNTVSGKLAQFQSQTKRGRGASERGFTLLELIIVIAIIVILATIALPTLKTNIQQARETTLRSDLYELRKSIDRFGADKGRMPQSLEELVEAEYIREIPVDPISREKNWTVELGPDSASSDGGQGVKDVHSLAEGTGLDGSAYSSW